MAKKLYVGNLLYEATDDQLRDHFSQAGNVVSAQVIRFADSGRSKGFGFVEMETDEEAQRAAEMFNEQDFLGRKVIVNEARPKTEGGNRGGFGGGRGRFNRDRRFGGGGGRGRFNRDNRDENRQPEMGNDDMGMDVDLGMDQE
ncbi:MAG TPA: RNA-binding protein [Candidatus Woesebacteria bacterium]|nr:RNA-binding protein [Candidatus Woesebacteria bacterium]